MDAAIMLAVSILYELCINQPSCDSCPFHDQCGKLPSEWID